MQPGDVIADRFEIQTLAGQGGMGAVYRALDRHAGELVAVKVMFAKEDGERINRFARETQMLAELRHPGIVRYVAHGVTPQREPYLAMEWVEGDNLSDRLSTSGLSIADSVSIARAVADALGAAHRHGVVHRDLKPSNLRLCNGSVDRVKVFDFGIARYVTNDEALTMTGSVVGTPWYMSPEQARGQRDLDARCDVFALGCVLFHCLTGRPPFDGEVVHTVLLRIVLEEPPAITELREDVPEPLARILTKMLAKAREDRYADAGAVAQALSALGPLGPSRLGPMSLRARALTGTERRMVSLVLACPTDEALAVTHGGTIMMHRPLNDALREVAERHGGSFQELADGSVLVSLVSPGAATDQAMRAARCALAMRVAMPDATMALGFGQEDPYARTTFGEVIDKSVALLGGKAARGIRVDATMAALLESRFNLEIDQVGPLLLGERDSARPERTLLGKVTPCVGRDGELAILETVMRQSFEDASARAVLITGPPGVGKSRLRSEFLKRLEHSDEPPLVWLAEGDPTSAGSSFSMLGQMIRSAAGIRGGEPAAEREQKLRARLAKHISSDPTPPSTTAPPSRTMPPPSLERVTEFIAAIAQVPLASAPSIELSAARGNAGIMGDQMRTAWEDLVGVEAAHRNLLFVLEDLQWGDLPTVKLIDSILRTHADRPIFVLAIARADVHQVFPKLWLGRSLQEIALRELSKKSSEKLARSVLGKDASDQAIARIVERSGGNAFFLEELIRAEASGETRELPDSVLAMLETRLSALDPEARRVLRAASVFGPIFWGSAVLPMLGRRTGQVEEDRRIVFGEWLRVLEEGEIIARRPESRFPNETEYAFRQTMVRDAAYAMLTEADRALAHRLAGRWLETAGETDARMLAEHYEAGGDRVRAGVAYARATDQALEANAFEAVLALGDRAAAAGLTADALGRVRLSQTEAARWHGDPTTALAHATEALALLEPGSEGACRAIGEAAVALGRLDRRNELGALIERLRVPPGPDAFDAHVIASVRVVMEHLFSGRGAECAPLIAEVLREVTAVRDVWASGLIDRMRAFEALVEGDLGSYLDLIRRATQWFDRAGDRRANSTLGTDYASALMLAGRFEEAKAALESSLSLAERLGLGPSIAHAKHFLGLTLAMLGKLPEALATGREAVSLFTENEDRRMLSGAHAYHARSLLLAGLVEEAELEARRAVEISDNSPLTRAFAMGVLSDVLLAKNRSADALAAAMNAFELMSSLSGIYDGEALIRVTYAEALYATGDVGTAREAIRAARQRLMERAASMVDASMRVSFLERVPENARTLARAKEWNPVA